MAHDEKAVKLIARALWDQTYPPPVHPGDLIRHEREAVALLDQLTALPIDPLGAAAMRAAAIRAAAALEEHFRCAGGFHGHAVGAKLVKEAINALPLPDETDLTAQALTLEPIKRLLSETQNKLGERKYEF